MKKIVKQLVQFGTDKFYLYSFVLLKIIGCSMQRQILFTNRVAYCAANRANAFPGQIVS